MSSRRSEGGPDACGILADLRRIVHSVMDDAEPSWRRWVLRKAFFVLESVEAYPFPAELASGLHLPRPTITYLVKQLETGGFIERRAEPGDLRKFRLVVTDSGRAALHRRRRALSGALGERLHRIDREDVVALDRIIKRLAGPKGRKRPTVADLIVIITRGIRPWTAGVGETP